MAVSKRKLILHIGTEKTGSTTLQGVMARSRDRLIQHGFAYPRTPGAQNHVRLAVFAAESRRTKALAQRERRSRADSDLNSWLPKQLGQEIASLPDTVHTVILSNEHCHSRLTTNDAVERLHRLLEPLFAPIEIVVYLRRQDELAVSKYSTSLRNGRAVKDVLPEKLAENGRRYFDYAAMLDRWGDVFGRESLKPRLFGREHFVGGDLVSDWLSVLGSKYIPVSSTDTARNVSLNPAGQELLLRLNQLALQPPPAPVRNWLNRNSSGPGRLPSRAQAQAFCSHFEKANERLRAEFFPERTSLFSDDFSRYAEAPTPNVGSAEILKIALNLVAYLSREDAGLKRPLGGKKSASPKTFAVAREQGFSDPRAQASRRESVSASDDASPSLMDEVAVAG